MGFSMMGSRGTHRHRITPKGYGRGPRGVVDKHQKHGFRKAKLDAVKTFDFAKPQDQGTKTGVFSRVRAFFRGGNR
jgi:hypothetical protein